MTTDTFIPIAIILKPEVDEVGAPMLFITNSTDQRTWRVDLQRITPVGRRHAAEMEGLTLFEALSMSHAFMREGLPPQTPLTETFILQSKTLADALEAGRQGSESAMFAFSGGSLFVKGNLIAATTKEALDVLLWYVSYQIEIEEDSEPGFKDPSMLRACKRAKRILEAEGAQDQVPWGWEV
jgi:hypothetical protein